MNKQEIIKEFKENPYLEFGEHEDLKALCVCSGFFGEEEEVSDFEELIFIVPTNWLKTFAKEEINIDDIDYWLQNEYISDESYQVYYAALNEKKIVMIDFN